MSPDIVPKLNLRSVIGGAQQNAELTTAAADTNELHRRPYLPPRRVFVSSVPAKSWDKDRFSPPPLSQSPPERMHTPPLISSPASFGPTSPQVSPGRAAPPWPKCVHKRPMFPETAVSRSAHIVAPQQVVRAAMSPLHTHNRVRSAGAVIGRPLPVVLPRAGATDLARGLRNPYGFLLAGGNVETGIAREQEVFFSPPLTTATIASPLTITTVGGKSMKTCKRKRRDVEGVAWTASVRGINARIINTQHSLLASLKQSETRVLQRMDKHSEEIEERLLNLERQLLSAQQQTSPQYHRRIPTKASDSSCGCYERSKQSDGIQNSLGENERAAVACPTGLEEYRLSSDLRRANSADTLFDNLSEQRHKMIANQEVTSLIHATRQLVSILLDRLHLPLTEEALLAATAGRHFAHEQTSPIADGEESDDNHHHHMDHHRNHMDENDDEEDEDSCSTISAKVLQIK